MTRRLKVVRSDTPVVKVGHRVLIDTMSEDHFNVFPFHRGRSTGNIVSFHSAAITLRALDGDQCIYVVGRVNNTDNGVHTIVLKP